MRIGYITKENPEDKKAYSGIHYHMYRALQNNFSEVIPFGPLDSAYKIVPKIQGKILRAYSNKTYKYQYNIGLAKRMASIIDQKIVKTQPEALLSSLMTPEVAFLKSKIPLYITTDATFPVLHEVYGSHSNLHPKSIREARFLEKKAYERAEKLILPLEWLADSVMKEYEISSSKIEVIRYGSNLDAEIQNTDLDQIIEHRTNSEVIKLLFVGIRWEEKGGPFAVEVLRLLLKSGVKAELQIVGCNPDIPNKPEEVHIIGFLDKEKADDEAKLLQLYRDASFFILPTKAECVGMSFIESASVALPAIGINTGGVPEAVLYNESGFIIADMQAASKVSDWIIRTWNDPMRYKVLAQNAYNHYSQNMNWYDWGEKVKRTMGIEHG